MAVDVGSVRVGVARSDPDAILAVPEATIARDGRTLATLSDIVASYEAIVVYVGLPLTLSGELGTAGASARQFARELAGVIEAPVHLVDERLSTVSAQRSLRDLGRSTRDSRHVIDQAAAVLILESALSRERVDGTPAGLAVTVGDDEGPEGGGA